MFYHFIIILQCWVFCFIVCLFHSEINFQFYNYFTILSILLQLSSFTSSILFYCMFSNVQYFIILEFFKFLWLLVFYYTFDRTFFRIYSNVFCSILCSQRDLKFASSQIIVPYLSIVIRDTSYIVITYNSGMSKLINVFNIRTLYATFTFWS